MIRDYCPQDDPVPTSVNITKGDDAPLCDTWACSSAEVDVDLIFVKARQGKHVFSLMARKGFVYAGACASVGIGKCTLPKSCVPRGDGSHLRALQVPRAGGVRRRVLLRRPGVLRGGPRRRHGQR